MNYPYEYSEKEQKLIDALNYQDIAMNPSVPPPLLYNCMAVECFRRNANDKIEHSVRRCLLAMEDASRKHPFQNIKRLTKEFDNLIEDGL